MASLLYAPAAFAEERSADYITSARLSRAPEYDQNRPLQVGEKVTLSFEWDASRFYGTPKAPVVGDTMTVTLPNWARFNEARVDMTDDGGTVWANCVQGRQAVTCTFTDAVTGKQDLKGGFSSTISLVKTEKIDSITIPVGPTTVSLRDVASEDVIRQGIVPAPIVKTELNLTARKEGAVEGVTESSDGFVQVAWFFSVRGTGADITITDTFTNGQVRADYLDGKTGFNQSVDLRTRDIEAEQGVGGNWGLAEDRQRPGGTATRVPPSDYTVTWRSDKDVTVTIPNSDTGKAYRVVVFTKVAATGWQNGDTISNTGYINDDQVSRDITARQMISAYGEGRDGFGSVYVYKNVTGLDPIPEGYEVEIKADIVQPDGTASEEFRKVKPGTSPENAAQFKGLPVGTKVTLREATPTEVPGYIFQGVTFGEGRTGETVPKEDVEIAADRGSVTVTVRNAGFTEIGATNAYGPEPKPKVGKFLVSKKVMAEGLIVPTDKEFTVDYRCTKAGADDITGQLSVKAGQSVESPEIPQGYSCVVTEDERSAQVDGAVVTIDNGARVEIVSGASVLPVVTVTNTYTPLGRLSLTKEISGLKGILARPSSTPARESTTTTSVTPTPESTSRQPVTTSATEQLPEFDVEASWLDAEGQRVTKVYKIAEGRITVMDPLPIGTVVTLKEILPASGWAIPEYYSKNKDLELTDNRDGTATVTVPKDSFKDSVNVVVKNKPNNPGGWFPFPPGGNKTPPPPGIIVPPGSVNTPPVTPTPNLPGTPGTVGPRPSSAPGSTTPPVSGRGVLANTGVDSVGLISVVALVLLAFGGLLLVKRRQGGRDLD